MKPMEKIWMLAVCTAAWIGLWMTGPENPEEKYSSWEITVFAGVLVFCFVQFVRYSSQHIQQRDADRLKKVLKRRDARTNR
jgi:hypothetical protein